MFSVFSEKYITRVSVDRGGNCFSVTMLHLNMISKVEFSEFFGLFVQETFCSLLAQ